MYEFCMMYVVLLEEGGVNTWYLASCLEEYMDGTYSMEYLHRVSKVSNLKWKNPTKQEIDTLRPESILEECKIDGEWDICRQRNMTFTLKNHLQIEEIVSDIV